MVSWSNKAQEIIHVITSNLTQLITYIVSLGPSFLLYHIVLFISYVLCFVYLYKPNTEMAAAFAFFLLHITFLFFLFSVQVTIPTISTVKNAFSYLPVLSAGRSPATTNFKGDSVTGKVWDITQVFNINYAEYSMVFIIIGWTLLTLAFGWFLPVYIRLYQAYIPKEMNMTFGNMEPYKETLFKYLIGSTVFIWLFYILQNIKHWNFLQNFMTKNRVANSFVIIMATLFIGSSVYSLQLARYISGKLHTIHISR